MLRGFRWQLALLVLAIVLLGAAIMLQPAPSPQAVDNTPDPTTSPAPTQTTAPVPLPPASAGTIVEHREGVVGQVQRLNPFFANLNPVDADLTRLIFEGLVTTNAYGEYIPQLAREWTISNDGLEYVFQLRQDILWQDGIPFTSTDVITTFGLLQAPGDWLPEDLTAFWRTVEVELLDEHTVRFRLAQPLAAFLDYLRLGILPAHVFRGLAPEQIPNHPFNLSPIGTGPYQLEHLSGDENGIVEVRLRVAPVYRQRPEGSGGYQMERLIFKLYNSEDEALAALRAAEIDSLGGIEQDITDLEQAGAVDLHITTAPTLGVLIFNWESMYTPAFADQRARLALTLGTDRSGLVNRHLSGRAILADSPIIPGSWAYAGPIQWPGYNPTEALNLLAEISFEQPAPEPTATPEGEAADAAPTEQPEATPTPPPPPYDFALLTSDDPVQVQLGQDLVSQWSQLGLNVHVENVPAEALLQRLDAGDFDTAIVELTLSPRVDPDSYVFWHQGQYPDGQNYGGINDRRSSELLELARRDPNGIHRAEYYAEFQQVFATRTLALPLYYPVYKYALNTGIEGIELGFLSSPPDRFFSMRNWAQKG